MLSSINVNHHTGGLEMQLGSAMKLSQYVNHHTGGLETQYS